MMGDTPYGVVTQRTRPLSVAYLGEGRPRGTPECVQNDTAVNYILVQAAPGAQKWVPGW